MSRIWFFAFLVIVLAAPAYSMTVDEAVDYALKNNPELQALRLEEQVAQGKLEKARLPLAFNPVIEGSLSKKGSPPEGGERFTDYGARLSQELEIAGQRGVRIDVAKKEISRVGFEIKDRERTLVSDVRDAFAKAIAAKKKAALTKDVVRLKEELLGFTKIKFQAGDVSGLDVNLAEVELSKAKKDLLSAEREQRDASLFLQGIMGLKPDVSLNMEGDLPSETPHALLIEDMRMRVYAQRPDMTAASLETERAKSAIELVKKEAVPNITVSGFYDRDERRNIAGVAFSVPLPLFDRKQAEKKEARAKAEQSKIKEEGLKKTIGKEVEQAYSDLSAAVEELSLFKKEILSKATENLGLITLAFKEGKIGFFDVRLAQRDTIETQFAYLDSQLRAQLAINAMERALGGSLK